MADTKIEWAEKTWNPVTGCTKISPGCANCYAERMSKRLAGRCGYPADNPFAVTLHPEKLGEPLRWKKPVRIFVCSMSDLFHPLVPFSFIDSVMRIIWNAEHHAFGHTFLMLTKRPERTKEFFASRLYLENVPEWYNGTLPQNLWLGVTAENQEQADKRIPILLQIPAAVRFVSVEPMLGPVDIRKFFKGCPHGCIRDALCPQKCGHKREVSLDWVICGGESGPGARTMHPDWPRSLRDQCKAASVPFLFKQWGEWAPESGNAPILPLMDKGKHGIWDEGGNWHANEGQYSRYENLLGRSMYRIGKKKAGRLLDGQLWDQYPEVARC